MRSVLVAMATLVAAAPLSPAPAGCPAGGAPLPAAYSAWSGARPLASASKANALDAATFSAGDAVEVGLHPDGEVTYVSLPQGAGEAASFGGLARLQVAQAGTYRVALGNFAWIDVDRAGKPLDPVAFGHGPACTAVKKVVDYRLEPGTYLLEISGNTESELRLMVVLRPADSPPPRE